MSKHTPGPWKLWNNMVCVQDSQHPQPCQPIDIFSADDWIHHLGEVCREEFEANARLIAAAPEMLELLRQCHPILDYSRSDEERNIRLKIRELIARVEGTP